MNKKIISILLTVCILMSTITVFAEKTKQDAEISSFLELMGVELPANEVDVEDINRAITKAEFVHLVVSNMKSNYKLEKKYLTFPDVKLDAWYHDNVVIAASKEIIYGKDNGYFGSDDVLDEKTGGLIILRALGFGMLPSNAKDKDNLVASYPNVYSKLLDGVEQDGVITLQDAYHMIYNMLFADYVSMELSTKSDSYHIENPFIEAISGIEKKSGRITGNRYTSFRENGAGIGNDYIEIDGVKYETASEFGIEYLGYFVDYFIDQRTDKIVYVIPKTGNDVFEISSSDLISCEVSNGNIVFKYQSGTDTTKKYTIPLACKYVYNGKFTGFTKNDIDDLINNKVGTLKIVEYGNNVMLVVTAYDTMIVENVSTYDNRIYDHYDKTKYVSIDDDINGYLKVIKDNEEFSPYDIKRNDVIQVAVSKDGTCKEIVVCDFLLTGAVTSYQNDKNGDEIGIDNVDYPVSKYFSRKRYSDVNLKFNVKQDFLFNAMGELVDIMQDSAVYDGEFVFAIAKNLNLKGDEVVYIKYVTMDAEMVTSPLAKKVKYNGTRSNSKDIEPRLPSKQLIYIKKNDEGEISVVNTVDQIDENGILQKNDILVSGAVEKERKCKQQSAWLIDKDDAHFPEFYTDSDTKILMVPKSDSDDETFRDIANYEKKSISFFQDAKDYTVEAFNLDDFNIAGVMLLKQEQTFDTDKSNNSLIVVSGVGTSVNDDGDTIPLVEGFQSGKKVRYKLKDDSVLEYMNKEGASIQKDDVIRLNLDSLGYVIHAQYIKNVSYDCAITNNPEGRNDGNAIAIGRVVSLKDNYLRLSFNETEESPDRVFRGNIDAVTVYDGAYCTKGTINDLTPGNLVLIRVYYTTLRDVIVIK